MFSLSPGSGVSSVPGRGVSAPEAPAGASYSIVKRVVWHMRDAVHADGVPGMGMLGETFRAGAGLSSSAGALVLGALLGPLGPGRAPGFLVLVGSRGSGSGVGRVNEGHLVDALASRGDEGRGTLRKGMGSREQALIRGFPNGETRPFRVIAR